MTAASPLVHFGPFSFDQRTDSLWQGTLLLPAPPKAAAVLRVLLQHASQVVAREALLEAVWPETFVTDTALKNCVNRLRQLLGDDPKAPRYIETWRRRGYRFIAPLTTAPGLAIEPVGALPEPLSPIAPTPSSQPAARSPVLLVGREAEGHQLSQWLGRALAGQRQVIVVSGEPGIGKTAFVEAFVAQCAAGGHLWVGHGQCLEFYGMGEPYHPVLEALDRLCRWTGGGRLLEILRQEAPTWLTQLPGLLSTPEAEALQHLLAQTTPVRMLRELVVALERLTADVPLVLVLEDLQWSDYGTVDLLTMLAQRRDPARLFVLATRRLSEGPGDTHPFHTAVQELRLRGQCQEVVLPLLPEPEVARYLSERFPRTKPMHTLGRWLHRWTSGHPLFLVLMVEYLVQQNWLTEDMPLDDLERMVKALPRHVPEQLRQLIERRMARLTPAEQQVLEVASVAGTEFSAAAVAAGLRAAVIPVEARCEALARRGDFLDLRGTATWPDGTVAAQYGFRHALYQQVVYERIPAARRQHLHQQLGLRLEQAYGDRVSEIATVLALHWQQGWDPAQAIRYRQQAAEHALRHHAHREAIDHLTTALELLQALPETPERAQHELTLQLLLAPAMSFVRGYAAPEMERVLTRARALGQQVGDAAQLFRVLSGLRVFYLQRAEVTTALELARQLLSLARRAHAPALHVAAHQALVTVLFWRGGLPKARAHVEKGLAVYDAHRARVHAHFYAHDPGVVFLTYGAWILWFLGYADQSMQRSREAQTLVREPARPVSLAIVLSYEASLHQFRREVPMAQERAEAALALANDHGLAFFSAWGTILRGWALAERGQGAEGIAHLHQGLAAHRATGAALGRPYFLALLAEAYGRAGQAAEGLRVLDEALAVAHRTRVRVYEAELYRLKGDLLLQDAGRGGGRMISAATEAARCWRQALAIARRQQAKVLELRATMSLARLLQQQGKRAAARQLLAPMCNWFTEGLDTADVREASALLQALGSAHAARDREVRWFRCKNGG
jgi:DNA-binding winged helix-turn-helix (wHTH) protein/predicted ATPase